MNGKVMLKGVPYFSDSQVIELTRAEYDALPNTKYTDGVLYCIKDEGVMKGDTFSPIIYSIAEREIGVWTDGKPLYQKTCQFTCQSDSTKYELPEDIVIHNIFGTISDNNDKQCIHVGFNCGTVDFVRVYQEYEGGTNGIHIQNSYFASRPKASITIQYTKTTDNPGTGQWTTSGVPAHHYSTSEQIVGTWIDGKPLYEKTIVGNTLGNSSTTTTLFTATVESIQKYDTVLKNASGNVVNSNMLYNGSYHYRVAVDSNGTRMYLTRNDVSVWQDWYPVVTIQYTKTTD